MHRYYPTLKEIVYTALSVIHNHPQIQEPIVKSPVLINGEYPVIPINRYRNYDGLELLEPGLTLSIFPKYSPSDKPYGGALAAEYKPYTMGNKNQPGFMYEATYNLVIHLAYQDIAINQVKELVYITDKENNVSPVDKEKLGTQDPFPKKKRLELQINPAEDILRDYLEVIRVILEQVDYYAPWAIRSTTITDMGFPTTSWSQDNKQIYFHQAYMNWEVNTYAPATYLSSPFIRSIEVTSIN